MPGNSAGTANGPQSVQSLTTLAEVTAQCVGDVLTASIVVLVTHLRIEVQYCEELPCAARAHEKIHLVLPLRNLLEPREVEEDDTEGVETLGASHREEIQCALRTLEALHEGPLAEFVAAGQ